MTSPASRPEHIDFDTEALPPGDRVARYRALYSAGADITQTGPNPRATFRGWRLDRAFLYDRRLNDLGHSRDARDLARYGLSHWTATLVLSGRMAADVGMGLVTLMPGDLLFMNTNAPLRNEAHDVRVATLAMTVERLEDVLGPLDGLHGLVLREVYTRLYDGLVRSLFETLPTLDERTLPGVTKALGGLLHAALEAHGRNDNTVPQSRDSTRLIALQAMIDARLGDQAFGPERVVVEAGLSRATLYRLLRPHGGLAGFVLGRRLEHLRRLLSDPHEHRHFGTIARAAGFSDEGQANRTFMARFGVRPGAYRAAVQRAEPDNQFRAWQQELR